MKDRNPSLYLTHGLESIDLARTYVQGVDVRRFRPSPTSRRPTSVDDASSAVVAFADLVFQTAPFRAPKDLPDKWTEALDAWMRGKSSADVIGICDDDGVDFVQEALMYRLPWAVEAVRVQASAVACEGADAITGLAALAVEAGSCDKSVIVLLRAGLSSREAAFEAVKSAGAAFEDRAGLMMWLGSEEVKLLHTDETWPTPQSRHAWLQFYEGETEGDRREWSRETQRVRVKWDREPPEAHANLTNAD